MAQAAAPARRSFWKDLPTLPQRTLKILWRTMVAYFDDNVSRLGAALAFYTTIAVAPLMVLAIATAAIVFKTEARETVISEISNLTGAPAADLLQNVSSPLARTDSLVATIIGVGTLLFGAFNVFYQLQDSLNSIWRVAPPPGAPKKEIFQRRLISFAMVVSTGFLLLVSLVASAALSWISTQFFSIYVPVTLLQIVNTGVSFAMITMLFALIFKLLPDTPIRWRDVWVGAGVTALLFTLGKAILSYYLANAALASAYGAAGSAIALLLWCYYAAQIMFLGAEFTRISNRSRGGRDFSFLQETSERVRTADPARAKVVSKNATVKVRTGHR